MRLQPRNITRIQIKEEKTSSFDNAIMGTGEAVSFQVVAPDISGPQKSWIRPDGGHVCMICFGCHSNSSPGSGHGDSQTGASTEAKTMDKQK
jgi:hypothetical protein